MWANVTYTNPCPVCQKNNWCSISDDNNTVICRRVPSEKQKLDKNGSTYYIHHIGNKKSDKIPIMYQRNKAVNHDTNKIQKVYGEMIELLSLSNEHREYLQNKRKLKDYDIELQQYRTIDVYSKKYFYSLIDLYREDILSVPGFYFDKENSKIRFSHIRGIAIPIRNFSGNINALLIKPDNEKLPKYLYISSAKHGGLPPLIHCHIPRGYENTKKAHIVEGVLKANIVASIVSDIVIGIPGVSAIEQAIECLDEINPNHVTLALDSDWTSNMQVNLHYLKALDRVGQWVNEKNKNA